MISCKLLCSVSFGSNLLNNVLLNVNDGLSVLETNVITGFQSSHTSSGLILVY